MGLLRASAARPMSALHPPGVSCLTESDRPLSPSVVCRTENKRGRETGLQGVWEEHLWNPHKTGWLGPRGRKGEGAEAPHWFPPRSLGTPRSLDLSACPWSWRAAGALSGAQAETSKEGRLRGPRALPALPYFPSTVSSPVLWLLCQSMSPSALSLTPTASFLAHTCPAPMPSAGGRPGLAGASTLLPYSQALRPVR